jgi:hypothetical protein
MAAIEAPLTQRDAWLRSPMPSGKYSSAWNGVNVWSKGSSDGRSFYKELDGAGDWLHNRMLSRCATEEFGISEKDWREIENKAAIGNEEDADAIIAIHQMHPILLKKKIMRQFMARMRLEMSAHVRVNTSNGPLFEYGDHTDMSVSAELFYMRIIHNDTAKHVNEIGCYIIDLIKRACFSDFEPSKVLGENGLMVDVRFGPACLDGGIIYILDRLTREERMAMNAVIAEEDVGEIAWFVERVRLGDLERNLDLCNFRRSGLEAFIESRGLTHGGGVISNKIGSCLSSLVVEKTPVFSRHKIRSRVDEMSRAKASEAGEAEESFGSPNKKHKSG